MLYSWLYAYRSTLFRLHPNRMVSPKYRKTKDIALGRIKFNASFAKSKVELYNFSNTIKWKYECVRCNAKIHSEREAEFYRWKKKTILWSDMNYLLIRNFLEYTKTSFYHPFCTQIITLRDENLLDRFFLFIISSGEMKIMKTFIDKVLNV